MEISVEKALANYFVCGLACFPLDVNLASRLNELAPRRYDLREYGQFFFNTPKYLDWAEDEQKVLLKLGLASPGDGDFASAADILACGLITPTGIDVLRLHGNACLVCFDKNQPEILIYNTLLGTQGSYYARLGQSLLFSNNLGTLARLAGRREINPTALPLHFIIREVPGRMTYFKDIFHLRPGEALHQKDSDLKVDLRLRLRQLAGEEYGRLPVEPETIEAFYDLLKTTTGFYVRAAGGAGTPPAWTNTLSGGVDSSVLQAAINSQLPGDYRPVSHTAVIEADSFAPEVEYAREAARVFATRHTFVKVAPNQYPDWLVTTIRLLGQPSYSEPTAYKTALFASLAGEGGTVKTLFAGQGADALNGFGVARYIYYYQKYKGIPHFIPRLLEQGLAPLRHLPRVGGVRKALRMYLAQDDPYLPDYFLNVLDNYTNWPVLATCFSPAEIHAALDYRSQLEVEYLNSDYLTEKVQVADLLGGASDIASYSHQLALAFGRQMVYPYLDDRLLKANFSFDPRERFLKDGRTKPVMKYILETKSTSQVTRTPKYGGGFSSDLFEWMRSGVLSEMVNGMQRPDFLNQANFEKIKRTPDWFTWNALNYDLFVKHVVKEV
jgi:asparagine synthetase B (glutamine-hydrolysing)